MSEIPREWQQSDIRYWFAAHETCPNCGIKLTTMHPMANLYPHWAGMCAQSGPQQGAIPPDISRKDPPIL
jgi:hypothetical protein